MATDLGPIPPHDLVIERAVLGAMLISRDDALAAVERLEPDDFYKGAHRLIFAAGRKVFERDQAMDVPLLAAELKANGRIEEIGGSLYLAELAQAAPTNTALTPYLEAIHDHSLKRQLIAAATECLRAGQNSRSAADVAGIFAAELAKVEERLAGRREKDGLADILKNVWATMETARPDVWPTGIDDFDSEFSGVMPGELIVIAAKRKGGKSTLALQWAKHWARDGRPILICSYEMSAEQISQVLTAAEAGVCLRKDWHIKFREEEEWPKVDAARMALSSLPIFIQCCAGKKLGQLEALCRLYHRKHKIQAVVVDYIQQVEADQAAERRDLDIATTSRRLKALAQNLCIPVVALSQLNDAGQTRESRAIEHDCDMLIHIEAPENSGAECEAQLIVKANRSGPTGSAQVRWQRGWRRFDKSMTSGGRTFDVPEDKRAGD